MFSAQVPAGRMTRKLKEMLVRRQNAAEEKEEQRKETALKDKTAPKEKTMKEKWGKKPEHLKVNQMNSLDINRSKLYLMWMFTKICVCGNEKPDWVFS